MSGNKVYEDLCYNEEKTERIKFVFKIRDFSKRQGLVSSSSFPSSAPAKVGKWVLHLHMTSTQDNNITVRIQQQTARINSAIVILSLMNDEGAVAKYYVTEYTGIKGCSVALPDRDYLLCKDNGLLPNDELTIVCEMEIRLPSENRLVNPVQVPTTELENLFI